MLTLRHFVNWVLLVLLHWKAGLVGGGVMGAMTAVLLVAEHWWKQFPKKYFIYVFVFGFLFVSGFLTWEDQYNEAVMWTSRFAKSDAENADLRAKNLSLDSEVQELQKKLSAGKQRGPEDTQLEIDAYRLADDIEMWWAAPDGVLIKTERTHSPQDQEQLSDYGRFNTPPPHWEPNGPHRDYEWSKMIQREFKDRFQTSLSTYAEHFKERGIVGEPEGLSHVDGPLGIRAAINYLRDSARELDAKRRTPKQ